MSVRKVREKTHLRVTNAARVLRCVPHINGRNLRSTRSRTIGVFILADSGVDDRGVEAAEFWYRLIREVQHECDRYDYFFNFVWLGWDNASEPCDRVGGRSRDGAIVIPQYLYHYGLLDELESQDYPFVMYNPWISIGAERKVITVDRIAAGKLCHHLIQRCGFRRTSRSPVREITAWGEASYRG